MGLGSRSGPGYEAWVWVRGVGLDTKRGSGYEEWAWVRADHVRRFPRPSPSVFAYCKRSKTRGVEGLGTRLQFVCVVGVVCVCVHTLELMPHLSGPNMIE